ncbi:MAG TPA: hypothetical protein VFS20_07875, partial [Longimicrobium sp.]|nr:hypothetical protein [Longimicrobium sp.]
MIRIRSKPTSQPRPRAAARRRLCPLALAAVAVFAAACKKPEPQSPFVDERVARMTTRQKVAQLLMVRPPGSV